jgi:aminopeptidase YwaD
MNALRLAGPLALLVLAAPSLRAQERAAITAEELSAMVHHLADDALAGRRVGTEELEAAGRYLAAALESAGLEPAGDDGTFLQRVPFAEERYTGQPGLALGEAELAYGADFRVRAAGEGGRLRVAVAGEGEWPAPDVEIALVLPEDSLREARERLEAQGAPEGRGYGAVVTFLRRAGRPTDAVPRGRGPRLDTGEEAATTWLEVSPERREALLGAAELRLDLRLERRRFDAHNVLGRLPAREGSPLGEEALVVSAHYDHIGTLEAERAPEPADGEEPDLVRNGADDDASGVATVVQIAEALAAEGPRERQVVFLLATAEEFGILGTRHYIAHPAVPLERTVANLNFEMVGRPDERAGGPGRLWLTGAERTNLLEGFAGAGLAIVADPYPEQNFFQRSDNIVFVDEGVVGQTLSTYPLHGDYHQVTDEADLLDYEHMRGCAEAGLRAVRMVADGELTPRWLEGGRPEPRRR